MVCTQHFHLRKKVVCLIVGRGHSGFEVKETLFCLFSNSLKVFVRTQLACSKMRDKATRWKRRAWYASNLHSELWHLFLSCSTWHSTFSLYPGRRVFILLGFPLCIRAGWQKPQREWAKSIRRRFSHIPSNAGKRSEMANRRGDAAWLWGVRPHSNENRRCMESCSHFCLRSSFSCTLRWSFVVSLRFHH